MPQLTRSDQDFGQLLLQFAKLNVRVIGVGGAGCASLSRLDRKLTDRVTMMGTDTGPGINNLPESATSASFGDGFGSGGDSELAARHFEQISEDVTSFVRGADVVIVVAGLGRGTGSGVSPLVAGLSRRTGALTLAVASMPFEFEGRPRHDCAKKALTDLRDASDSVFEVGSSDVVEPAGKGTRLTDVFEGANRTASEALGAIVTALENCEGRFDEVSGYLRNLGLSVVMTGSSQELHAGKLAVEIAFGKLDIGNSGPRTRNVESALIHVEGGIAMSAGQIAEVVASVRARIKRRAVVNVSSSRKSTLGSTVRVTLVVSGAETPTEQSSIGDQQAAPGFLRIGRTTAVAPSIFETPRPIRSRGPMLLPAG